MAAACVTVAGPAQAASSHALATTSAPRPLPPAGNLYATIAPNDCSAALVRYPTSKDTDRALMLTNGHCYEGGEPDAGEVVQNMASDRSGTLLDGAGRAPGTVRTDKLLHPYPAFGPGRVNRRGVI